LSVHSGHRLGSNFGFLLGIRSKWVDVDALAFVVLALLSFLLHFYCCVGCCIFTQRAGIPNFPKSTFLKIELASKWHRSDTDVTGEVKSTRNRSEVNKNSEWSEVMSEQLRNEIQVKSNRTPLPPLSNLLSDLSWFYLHSCWFGPYASDPQSARQAEEERTWYK
jgi:hypothetical protein